MPTRGSVSLLWPFPLTSTCFQKSMMAEQQGKVPVLGSPHPKHSSPGEAQLPTALPKVLPTLTFSVPVPSSVDVGKSPDVPYVYVRHHGEVQNLKPIQVVTACSLDIYNFPFDVQNCSLTFTSWLHNSERAGGVSGPGLGQAAPCRGRVPL